MRRLTRGAFRLPSACPSPPLQCSREPWLLEVLKPVRRLPTITGYPFASEQRYISLQHQVQGCRVACHVNVELIIIDSLSHGGEGPWITISTVAMMPWEWACLWEFPMRELHQVRAARKGEWGELGVQVLKDSSIGLTFIIRVFANLGVWTWSNLQNVFSLLPGLPPHSCDFLFTIEVQRDITLPTKVCINKAMIFPVVMYGCESWTTKKAERWRVDTLKLSC